MVYIVTIMVCGRRGIPEAVQINSTRSPNMPLQWLDLDKLTQPAAGQCPDINRLTN